MPEFRNKVLEGIILDKDGFENNNPAGFSENSEA